MPRLSTVIIARDEEADIGRSLDAVRFADEILVVDSGSTDRTVEICRSRGARVLEHGFEGYGPQKRWAVAQSSNDWVLCIDADEVLTPDLARAIRELLAGDPPLPAYRLTFHTVFMGRALSRGAIGRRGHVRLFDRRRARWNEARVHETVEVDGPVGSLPGVVHHHNVRDLSEAVVKLDRYSRLGAEELVRCGGRPRSAAALLALTPYHFLRHWLLNGNVLNGIPGFGWAFMLTATSVLKHLKVRELEGDGGAAFRGAAPPRPEDAAGAR
jgi:glycosyltransferase involved in cell wall biosynthesis